MKNKKALLISLCAIMLVAATIFGTLAYLTSTDKVTNTFTVGNVAITLDEAKVGNDGKAITPEERVDANSYKLLPGHEYDKDPTVHVAANSETCYVFVKVENGISAIEADDNTIAAQIADNGWKVLEGVDSVYYKEDVAGAAELVVFETFVIAGEVTNEELEDYDEATVVVTAYAVQDDGLSLTEAWNAVKDITVE